MEVLVHREVPAADVLAVLFSPLPPSVVPLTFVTSLWLQLQLASGLLVLVLVPSS